jgi:ATP/maltotriose-dependent transcriptional regulator MalT
MCACAGRSNLARLAAWMGRPRIIGSMVRRVSSFELVGRTAAVGQLMSALASARDGVPRHVLVIGEAGVGKTRLLSRARELADADGTRVLLGGCVNVGDAGLPFAPYAEIVRSLLAEDGAARLAAVAGHASHDLAKLVPEFGPEDAPPAQELLAQTRIYEALLRLLRRLCEDTPILVHLEDLHWADAGTLAATSFLLRAIRDEPIAIAATLRSGESLHGHRLRPWLAEVGRSEGVERLELDPLDEAEVGELVRSITGDEPTAAAVAEYHQRSDGNPYFVEELIASGVDDGAQLPSSLRDVLLSRVDALDEAPRHLLGIAAVGGREVDHQVLVAMADDSEERSIASIKALVDAGLFVPRSAPTRDSYAFRHALLQEAVYGALLPSERRRLHRAFGEELASVGTEVIEEVAFLIGLAHHWREARDPRAISASIRAGDAAMSGYAYDIALREYERALQLWVMVDGEPDPDMDRAELLVRTGRAAYFASDYKRAVAAHRESLAEFDDDVGPIRRAEYQGLLGRALWVAGDWSDAVDSYEEALRLAPTDVPTSRIRALAGLGQCYMLFGWFARSRPLCEEAVELARSIGARDLESHALTTLSISLAASGDDDAALEAVDAGLAIAQELDLPDDIGRGFVQQSDVLNLVGYPDRALESVRQGIEVVVQRGMALSYGSYLRLNGVSFAYQSGAWDEAAALLADVDRSAPAGAGMQRYRAEYALGFLVSSGAPEAPDVWAQQHRVMSESLPSASMGLAYVAGVEAAALEGRYDDAVGIAWEGLDRLEQSEIWLLMSQLARVAAWPVSELGRLARHTADAAAVDEASDRISRLASLTSAARAALVGPDDRLRRPMAVDEAQILAERARMIGKSSAEEWRSVAASWSELGRPYPGLYARWREAEAANDANDRETALTALRSAYDTATRLGARPLTAELEVLARKMRIRLGRPPTAREATAQPAFGLTPREREVLVLVAAGRTNRQIAEELFISESTAGVHVSNILGKLGVSSRTEAANVALTQGLTEV